MLACSGLVEEVIRSIVTISKLNVKCGDRMLHYLPILTNVLQCLRTFPLKSNSYTFEISLTWILYPAHDLKFCFAISSHCIIYLAGIKASSNCNCCQESTWVSVCKYIFLLGVQNYKLFGTKIHFLRQCKITLQDIICGCCWWGQEQSPHLTANAIGSATRSSIN